MTVYTLKGDWREDGYLSNARVRDIQIEVEHGAVYELDDYGHRLLRMRVRPDGVLVHGGNITFAPDAGELSRAGITI